METSWIAEFVQYSVANGLPDGSLVVALIVGTILYLINQADVLIAGAKLNWIEIA